MINPRASRVAAATRASLLAAAVLIAPPLIAQTPAVPVASEFGNLHFRSIGPATMSGRIAAISVYEADPSTYYVGTAHGGVWKTTSNGSLWTPLLQHQGLLSIGAVTVSQRDPNLVWVGTGESNNRQSISWGDGVYKSTDGGVTFTHMGLRESKHIHKIVIDPIDSDIVFVAATGPVFGSGGERGLYKSTDAGKTWTRVLHVDDDTGVNDLVMHPTNPKVMFTSTYQRRRTTCCMVGGGEGSALWKSVDGGDTWNKVEGGYPSGMLGRIAVDIARSNPQVVYSLVEAPTAAGGGTQGLWRSDDGGLNWRKVNSVNPRPMYFSKLLIDPSNSERVYHGGVGLHVSHDGGKTVETDAARAIHDDVHAIWVNPANPKHVLIGNDGGLATSYDGAFTWQFIPNLPVGLFYHVSYDMETPFNVCGGMQDNYNWCGPSRSRFGSGIMNYDWFQILGGDGFVALPDPRDSRIVYTESQNGNMIRRNIQTGESRSIRPTVQNVSPAMPDSVRFRFHWDAPMMLSPHDAGTLLVAANHVFKSTDRGDSWTVISPDLTTNADRDTFVTMGVKNTDIRIARNDGVSQYPTIVSLAESPKQAGVIWAGSEDGVVSVTQDGGSTWTNVSRNLPGLPAGAFISEVVPSRFDAGTAYVTVDHHRENDYGAYVWMTTDFGRSFKSLRSNLSGQVVRTLTEDTRTADVLYIGAEDGIYVTLDRGTSWRKLNGRNMPNVRIDELTIHPRDNALIVASHGRSIWILDDLAPIQEYAAAQQAQHVALFSVPQALQWKYLDNRNDEFWGHQFFVGENPPIEATMSFLVKTPPRTLALRVSQGDRVVRELSIPTTDMAAGIHTACWDMRAEPIRSAAPQGGGGGGGGARPIVGLPTPLADAGYMAHDPCSGGGGGGFGGAANLGPYVAPGDYTIALVSDSTVVDTKPMRIVMDPKIALSGQDRVAYDAFLMDLHTRQQRGTDIATTLRTLADQAATVNSKLGTTPNLPADVRTRFTAFVTSLDSVRVKFGVPAGRVAGTAAPAAGGGGGGGFGGGGNSANVLGRLAQVKGLVGGIWETPSAGSRQQAEQASQALDAAITEAQAVIGNARAIGAALTPFDLTLGTP